jgi:hypothetical protein
VDQVVKHRVRCKISTIWQRRSGISCTAESDFLATGPQRQVGDDLGRTVPTYRLQLEHELRRWHPFRAALRAEDQSSFDSLFVYARTYADAGSAAARPCPSEALFMSMLLGLYQEVQALRYALAAAVRRTAESQEGNFNEYLRRVQAQL